MIRKLFLTAVLILVLAVSGWGADQNIYLDNTTGGDGSIGSPYSTFAEINWTTGGANSIFDWVDGGDDVYINLKKGVTWRKQLTVGTSGASGHPITIQAYGSGADPIINAADVITGWSSYGGGTSGTYYVNNIGWIYDGGSGCNGVLVDGSTVLKYNTDQTNLAEGEYHHSDTNDDLYVRLSGEADPSNHTIEAQIRFCSVEIPRQDYITVQNLEMNSGLYGVWIWDNLGSPGSDHCIIQDNIVEYNFSKSIKIEGGTTLCTNNIIRRNILRHVGGSDKSDIHPWGIGLDGKAGNGNNTITENLITDIDGDGGISIQDGCDSNTITYNKILDLKDGVGILLSSSDSNEVVYNIIEIDAGEDWGIGISSGAASNKIYNNTIEAVSAGGIMVTGDVGNGNLFKNNIVYTTGYHCFRVDSGGETNLESDYNCFYSSSGGDILRWLGTDYDTSEWTDYKAASNQDAHSPSPSDPLFTDLASDNYTLESSSPCIDIAVDLGDTYDDALDPVSSWPDSVSTLDQDDYGPGWEIGAYVYESNPEITVTATDSSADEDGGTGTYTISCSPDCDSTSIDFTMSGTATENTDYTLSDSDSITITGASDTITLTPIDETDLEGDETATITIDAGSGYTVGSPDTADITIADNDVGVKSCTLSGGEIH